MVGVDLERCPGAKCVVDTGQGLSEAEERPQLAHRVVGASSGGWPSLDVGQDLWGEILIEPRNASQALNEVEARLIERNDRVGSRERGWGLVHDRRRRRHVAAWREVGECSWQLEAVGWWVGGLVWMVGL